MNKWNSKFKADFNRPDGEYKQLSITLLILLQKILRYSALVYQRLRFKFSQKNTKTLFVFQLFDMYRG